MPAYEFAIRYSTCDDKACEICRSSDGNVMSAAWARMWEASGKEHDGCRCNVVYMTAWELGIWLYNNPDYQSCSGSPRS